MMVLMMMTIIIIIIEEANSCISRPHDAEADDGVLCLAGVYVRSGSLVGVRYGLAESRTSTTLKALQTLLLVNSHILLHM